MSWDARTRQNSRRTRVRRGDARATPLPARRCRVQFFFFFFRTRADSAQSRADSRRIGRNRRNTPIPAPNRPIQAETQKNKRCETHRLDKNLISQSAVFSISILIFSSLSLSGLCAPRHGSLASALHLPSLTQSHSQESQLLTHSHSALRLPSGINLKLSILVFHSSQMLWLLLNVSVIWFFYFLFLFFI